MSALIVIDMQPGFEEPTHVVPVLEGLRARIIQGMDEGEYIRFVEYAGQGDTYSYLLRLVEKYYKWDRVIKHRDSAEGALDPRLGPFTLVGQNLCGCVQSTVKDLERMERDVKVKIDLSCSMCGAWFYSLHQCSTRRCRALCRLGIGPWKDLGQHYEAFYPEEAEYE